MVDKKVFKTIAVAVRPKHPHGRRNTYLHTYLKHALGYATASWEESLTVKFRDLRSRERRLYGLTMGYSFRGGGRAKRHKRPRISHGHATTMMARFRELLEEGGRTVEGIFEALGVDTRRVTRRQYRAALDHMSARAGTGVPIGGAENALAFLYRQGERVWEFLDAFLLGLTRGIATTASTADQRDATNDSRGSILDKNFESEALSVTEQDRTVEHQNQELSDCDKPDSDLGKSTNSWSILQLSTALSAFIFGRKGQGDTLHNQDVRDLMNFLYLEDQAKRRNTKDPPMVFDTKNMVSMLHQGDREQQKHMYRERVAKMSVQGLKALTDKYGRWTLERCELQEREAKAELEEASKRAAAGRAFMLTAYQVDIVVDFLDPNKDGHIDLEELAWAFKSIRTATSLLEKEDRRREQHQSSIGYEGEAVVDGGEDSIEQKEEADPHNGNNKEQCALFTPQEAREFTAYLTQIIGASSLMNVVDIQHGMRRVKRVGANLTTCYTYQTAAKRFADQMRAAGLAFESRDAWASWFDMCELGLRGGGAVGARRLLGRTELKRGLKALDASMKTQIGVVDGTQVLTSGWSDNDIDDLTGAVVMCTDRAGPAVDREGDTRKDVDFAEEAFRQGITLAVDYNVEKDDPTSAIALEAMPLIEKLELHLKENGVRLTDLFRRMVAWAGEVPEKELLRITEDLPRSGPALAIAERGDESCVPPAAFHAILLSLRYGKGMTTGRPTTKEGKRLITRASEELRLAEEAAAKASKRLAEAERSGALAVLKLLQSSMSVKGIRLIDLFRGLDTSKDGLISSVCVWLDATTRLSADHIKGSNSAGDFLATYVKTLSVLARSPS